MAYSKTTWADRIDSGNKYTITDNGDGTKAIAYAGDVIQQGTPVNADNLNKIEQGIYDAHENKVDKETGKGLSSNDYTTAEKNKLAGLSNITVDDALSDSSTNPVQNKKVKQALDGKVDTVSDKGLSTNDFTNDYKVGLDSGVKNATFITAMDAQYNSLKNIYFGLGGKPTAWADIQEAVRAGDIGRYYSVGDQLNVNYNNTAMVWDIVAIDVAVPADTSKTHSMTLMSHNLFYNGRQFDAAEPNNPDSNRKTYGNNRYAHSAIRQWLNSSANAGSWWTPQHEYDAAPDYATTADGFMKGFDADFLAVLGSTKIKVVIPTIDGGGYEELTDTFYLPSRMEVGLGAESSIEEGVQFPYFTDNTSRVKCIEGNSNTAVWWFRTSDSLSSRFVIAALNGAWSESDARSERRITPVCNII